MPFKFTLTDIKTLNYEVLQNDPIGWENASFLLKRNDVYKGMASEYITTLKFHCKGGGRQFIDTVYERDFVNGRIDIYIEYDCDGSGAYDMLYRGILNLSSYAIDGDYGSCTIEQSDLLTKLFTRDEINVDIERALSIGEKPIEPASITTLTLPSVEIYFENEWRVTDNYFYAHAEAVKPGSFEAWVTHQLNVVKSDMDTVYPCVEVYDTSADQAGQIGAFELSAYVDPILTARETGVNYPLIIELDFRFKGKYYDDETSGGGFRNNQSLIFKIIKGKIDVNDTNSIEDIFSTNQIGGFSADNYDADFDIGTYGTPLTFQLDSGESVWVVWQYYNTSTGNYTVRQQWNYEIGYIKMNSRTKYKETTAKAVMVHESFNQVVDAIADSDNNFYSEFYGRIDSEKATYDKDGCAGLLSLTNGLNIRKFPLKPLLFNFREMFRSLDALHNIGMGLVDDKIRVEQLGFFFNSNSRIITLPFVNTYTRKVSEDRMVNKAVIGYDKWETEFKGGLDEVNTKHEYSTIVSSTKGTLNKLSNYIASTYAIELTRRKNIDILPTEDWRYDNDVFFIAVKRFGPTPFKPELYADAFSSGNNMQVLTTAYNLRLTPTRMLLAHLNVITAGLQKIEGNISFAKGEGNTALELTKTDVGCQEDFDGQPLKESQSIEWSDDRAKNIRPLWFPEIYSFEYPLTYQQFKTIKANPYGYIEFYRFENDKKAGYILNMEYQLKTGMTKFELLRIFAPEAVGDENGNYVGDTINDELIMIRG